ncbi:PREDICTED: uncharacterized protein LOC106141545 [Paramuricea clavata]|uniref:PREDICTED: uncharacterized protein LOC106141545 n=1 Tax=Paramuricea clavata TaxID=317549 RepID=A0A6S7J0R6_PARCT|nr:PREDICTED: uncharacterized protein LOC106141545 [Paramuricea clavata]
MSNRTVTRFKNNLPGEDWARSFIKRHAKQIRPRVCQNIKTSRSEINKGEFVKYFDNLKDVVKEVPADKILNYDETNLADDPGQEKLIFKRGKKYPERVMNYTKGNISIMFCGTASGELLPVYVVYKNVHMWTTWTTGGPKYARYNRSKSGWFEAISFNDWFRTVVLPWARKKEGKKVVIGDNLSSHFSPDIIRLCEENNISFVCLVPNSTHLTQPLDVAFYGPLKRKWRKILKQWKIYNPSLTSLPKNEFPRLLKELVESLNTAGFQACGIYPLNPNEVLKNMPQSSEDASINISTAVIEQLKKMRNPIHEKPTPRRKQIVVEPGKSVSLDDLTCDKDDASEHDSEEESDSDESQSEGSIISDLSDQHRLSTRMEDLKPLEHNDINIGQWVKVIHEEELFVGKVLKKTGGETLVQCLQKPFGIREPQSLERENDSVYYQNVYEANVTPQLQKVGRCWKYNC